MDPLLILLAALVIDAAIGDPAALWRRVPHPVALIGRLIIFFEAKLNRPDRSETDRALRGGFVVLGLVALAAGIGIGIAFLAVRWPWGWAVEGLAVWTLLAQKSLFVHVRAVGAGLLQGGLMGGRWAVSRIVGRDPQSLDEYGVARAAIESCAESFADGVVAPVFWFLLAGLPGMIAYKTANTLDSMIGHKEPRYRAFGMVAARLDDVMNLIPARLAGLLLVLAMPFVPGGHPLAAWRVMWRDHGYHDSPNSGWPEAAMAGGLGLALGGPRTYDGKTLQGRWIGDGRARAGIADIRRSLLALSVGCLLNGGIVILCLWWGAAQ